MVRSPARRETLVGLRHFITPMFICTPRKTLIDNLFFCMTISSMNKELIEETQARFVLNAAMRLSTGRDDDREAAVAAIIVRAVELATPGLTPELRAGLFLTQDKTP